MGYRMTTLLGIDLGTSSVKTAAMDPAGRVVGLSQQSYDIHSPLVGYAEQEPQQWWEAVRQTLSESVRQAGSGSSNRYAIGLSGQMHGLVAIGMDGRVLRPAIIWCDQRSIEQKEQLEAMYSIEQLGKLVQNRAATGFLLLSLLWLKQNEPDTYEKIWKVMLPKDYIRYKLTGEIGTESTDASGTLAYDVANKCWSRELLGQLGIDPQLLPTVREPWEVAGTLTAEAATDCAIPAGTIVVFGGADQPMQAIGNGILHQGQASCTLGTGGQWFVPVATPTYDSLLRTHTFTHAAPGKWYMMAAMLSAGLSHRWLTENILQNKDSRSLDESAAKVPPGSEGLIFLPYLTGERTPHMDPFARGAMFGLTLKHTEAHLVRSVMEGVAFGLRDGLEVLVALGVSVDRIVMAGGGAKSAVWLQILADVLSRELYPSAMKEQACIGAAMMAGVGAGIYASIEEACEIVVKQAERPITPILKNRSVYEEQYAFFRELYQCNKELFKRMSGLTNPSHSSQ
ncbi:xylulokinase [Paenibacillus sp. V4I7]|nr:xylulokinase [Paenibacillus sp. V4I7]MDQ0921400.1 xylulokinase [Paenibacillus sp. V4I5]